MIEQLRYVRLPTTDLIAAEEFARNVIGLAVASVGSDYAKFRSDQRSYSLEYDASGATCTPTIAVEVRTPELLDGIATKLSALSLSPIDFTNEQCLKREVYAGIAFVDYSGNGIEIVVRAHNKGRRPFLSRDAGITAFSGLAFRSAAMEQDLRLWCEVLGCEVRDYVGGSAFLGFDKLHHRIALHPGSVPGLLSMVFEVENFENVMQSLYFLSDRQIRVVDGPGCEPFSDKIFLSFSGRDGFIFTYCTGISNVGEHWRPRQFADVRESFCCWNSPVLIPELVGKQSRWAKL